MVIGAATGAAVWRLLEPLGLVPSSPAVLVVIGMAACLGAIAHAPVAVTVMASVLSKRPPVSGTLRGAL